MAVGIACRLRCASRSALARRNSLHSLRSLRSDNRRESDVKRALRARRARCCDARRPTSRPHRAPPTALRRSWCSTSMPRWCRQSRGRVCAGSDICGAEERRARGRARQRASCSDSSRLFERSERSERSEFRDGPRDRAPQGTLRAAKGCRIRAPAHTRPRLCLAQTMESIPMNAAPSSSTILRLPAAARRARGLPPLGAARLPATRHGRLQPRRLLGRARGGRPARRQRPVARLRDRLGHARIAYREYLWDLGLGVAEAMDTAQRGMGLDWPTSLELIRRAVKAGKAWEARTWPAALIASGAAPTISTSKRATRSTR